ncbi:MAG: TIR domain-containing protein [Parvularculaceae bacterium]|nr:TIR domain-containing protein [Parvularculaceae bacterium]
MAYRYKAFISYSWADKASAEWVHRALETYRPPKTLGASGARLHPIFRDREEEAAGRGIGAAIEEALDVSEFLIVLCSPNSAKSQWVNREIGYFKRRRDPDKVLALIVGGEPGHATNDCFPRALTHKPGEDYQPTDEAEDPPLAADARKEGDGKRRAKLKLAAAMLGVGLDELVRRDERRRTMRRRWAMSGMAAGMAVLGGLSLYAFKQRDAAITARNDAVKARDDAEGIIELILTDLKSDLEGFGTLKSVTMIGNRAIGYYEGQDVKALTPDQLGRRARVLLMLGEADNKRGDLTAALARYETAAATTSEQLARDPDNAQRIFDHAQSVFWVGYIAWQRGDREKAKAQFTEYHRHATRLVEIDPANDDWQAELEYAYSNLGTLAMDEGEAADAEGWFRKSLEVSDKAIERRTANDIDRRTCGWTVITVGLRMLFTDKRKLDEARKRALRDRVCRNHRFFTCAFEVRRPRWLPHVSACHQVDCSCWQVS